MNRSRVFPSFLIIVFALISTGCPSDDKKDDSNNKSSDGGAKGDDGGDRNKSDAAADDGKTGSNGGSGGSVDKSDSGTTDTQADSGSRDIDKDAGAGGSGGSSSGGSGGSGSAALDKLCADIIKLEDDKAKELGCSSSDGAPTGRLCEVSGSCIKQLQAHYDCKKAATTWSCDTGDGHPQTNASCKDTEQSYFSCLMTAVHDEDPFGCAAVAKAKNDAAKALGCNADTMIENNCNQYYLRDICLDEWKAVTECVGGKSNSDLECDSDNNLQPKDGVCTAERTAFDDCIAALKK